MEIFSLGADLLKKALRGNLGHNRKSSRAGKRVPPESRAVSTLCKHVPALFVRKAHAYGNSARNALCKSCDIWLNAVLLRRKESSRSARARLHLVGNNKYVPFCAYAEKLVNKAPVKRINTAFALNKFYHHSADRIIYFIHKIGNIIRLRVQKALGKGEKVVVENLLPRCRKSSERSAVKAVGQSDYIVPLRVLSVLVKGIFSCNFYGALVSLCAAVAEKHFFISGDLGKLVGEISLNFRIVVVGRVLHQSCLFADRLRPVIIAVAKGVCAYAAAEIYVAFPVLIKRGTSLSLFKNKRVTPIGAHDVFIKFFYSTHVSCPFNCYIF